MYQYLQQLTPTYYDTLVRWEKVEEIMELIEETERAEAYHLLAQALDHAVLDTILSHLPELDHELFLELCYHQHHEPTLLSWLEERSPGISDKIRVTIQKTKIIIKEELIQDETPIENSATI